MILPILLISVISYLLSENFQSYGESVSYYFFPVMLFMYVGYGVNSSFSFLDLANIEGNRRLFFMPVKKEWIIISHVFSQTMFGVFSLFVNYLVSYILFRNYYSNFVFSFFALSILIFLSNALGIWITIFITNTIVIEEIFTVIQIVLALLGGGFYSLERIANIPRFIVYLSPLKWLLDVINVYTYTGKIRGIVFLIFGMMCISIIALASVYKRFDPYKYI